MLAGVMSYGIEISFLLLLNRSLGLSAQISVALAFWVGFIATFTLQKVFTFKDYQKETRAIGKQLGFFILLVLWNYLFTIVLISVFDDAYLLYTRTAALIITTIWNYLIYQQIFSKNNTLKTPRNLWVHLKQFSNTVVYGIRIKSIVVAVVIVVSIVVFFWQYAFTGSRLIGGDFDYYAQMYEAFRISVLEYGQFPSWNPWMSGGVPLFTNPQFGLLSIQSLLVLVLGTIPGLKWAYILYALLGYFGMYMFTKTIMRASAIRAILLSYIWIFSGFFAGHSISHFTFALFFLLPWFVFFIAQWQKKYSWIGLGGVAAIVALSSLHYAFLMIGFAMAVYIVMYLAITGRYKLMPQENLVKFGLFIIKSGLIFIALAGYRIITTYAFTSANARPATLFSEAAPPPDVLFRAMFLPVGTVLPIPQDLQWGWGEYSAYIGFFTLPVLLLIIGSLLLYSRSIKLLQVRTQQKVVVITLILIGVMALAIALGDFAKFSPFNILRQLPGFTETRVSSRWLIFFVFSLLSVVAYYKRHVTFINLLLGLSVIELFVSFGPLRNNGANQVNIPEVSEKTAVMQLVEHPDMRRIGIEKNLDYSYYYATRKNMGHVYADDSLINTLNKVLLTSRCGENVNPACDLVLSDNATVEHWSPNRILLTRTAPGSLILNINPERGWRINSRYIYHPYSDLDPKREFIVAEDDNETYELIYAPRLSPDWMHWKINTLL